VNRTEVQQVWFVVSPQNPFKTAGSLLNEYDRLHLVNLAIENDEARLRASDVEFKLPRPSYTIDTLIYLEEKYPQHEFSIIMGSDGFENITRWKNADVLLKKYAFYVYLRPGFETVDTIGANVTILHAPELEKILETKKRFVIWFQKMSEKKLKITTITNKKSLAK
jgi:nicotinate-nucleotide adenylyltransferase